MAGPDASGTGDVSAPAAAALGSRGKLTRKQQRQDPTTRFLRASAEAASAGRWEEALRLKDSQLNLVNHQNDALRQTLARLEAELQVLSDTVTEKERAIYVQQREVQRRDEEIQRIQALANDNKGQEQVLEHAQKQNSKLLRLLEMQEENSRTLAEAKSSLEAELKTLRRVQKNQLQEAASTEARLQGRLRELQRALDELGERWDALNKRHEGFEEHCETVEKNAAAKVEAMMDELTERRDQQYVQLQRLEHAEMQLHRVKDREESARDASAAVAERSHEVEARLRDALSELALRESQIVQLEEAFKHKFKAKDEELDQARAAKAAHEQRVDELSRTLMKVVDKQKTTQSTCTARDAQVSSLRSHVKTLTQDLERSERHAQDQHERLARAHDELEALEAKSARLQAELTASVHADLGSRHRSAGPQQDVRQAVDVERQGKRQALRLYLLSVKLTPTLTTVTLSDCTISDDDLPDVVKLCAQCAQLERVELRSNLLTDASAPLLGSVLNDPASKVRYLDLQNNLLSIASVKTLAHVLESTMVTRGVTQVRVHDDGQIEAVGDAAALPPSLHVDARTVALVDVRNNYGLEGLSSVGAGKQGRALRPSQQSTVPVSTALRAGVATLDDGVHRKRKASKRQGDPRSKHVAAVRQMMLESVYGDTGGLEASGCFDAMAEELPEIHR